MLLAACVHFLHGFQVKRNASAFLRRADQTEEQEDLRLAAAYLSGYLAFVPGIPTPSLDFHGGH